jgi:glycosyltransferase involved in cell wall biosynthesis
MRLLYLTKYPRLGASSRLRSYQYFPLLEKVGNTVNVSPLFDEHYLKGIYNGDTSYVSVFKGYAKRFFKLFSIFKYDMVVIEYELFPYFPSFFEYILSKLGVKYIVDYDDAIFHNYNLHPNIWVRKLLGDKIASVMKNSACVLAGNNYLAEYAKKAGAKRIDILPTVIDGSRYVQKTITSGHKIVIGWIGSPSTFKYLKSLRSVFEKLGKQHNIEIQIVGANKNLGLSTIEKQLEWSEATEVASILKFDIGIMPLEDSPWAKGKCSYKLIQYMACGIPVICSPVGMNIEVVNAGVNGYLASSEEEWESAFEKLIESASLRAEMGQAGYTLAKENYTLQVQVPKIVSIIKELQTA